MLNFFKKGVTVFTLLFICSFTNKSSAQYVLYPATVHVTQAEFNALDQNGSISIIQNSPHVFTGDGQLQMGPGPGPYHDPDPCPDQHTPEIFQQALNIANSTCQDVKICLQGPDCAMYLYLIKPTAPNCIYTGIGPYQPLLSARRL